MDPARGQRQGLATSCFSTFWKAPAFPDRAAPPPAPRLRARVPHHFSFPHPLPPSPVVGSRLPLPSSPRLPSFSHLFSGSPLFSLPGAPIGASRVKNRKPRQQGPTSQVCVPRPPVTFLLSSPRPHTTVSLSIAVPLSLGSSQPLSPAPPVLLHTWSRLLPVQPPRPLCAHLTLAPRRPQALAPAGGFQGLTAPSRRV